MGKCKIIIGNITKDLEVDRPTFQGFKEEYVKILDAGDDDSLRKLKLAMNKQLLLYKRSSNEIDEIFDEKRQKIENTIESMKQFAVYPRYVKVGGQVLAEYSRFMINRVEENKNYPDFSNSCALCVSYAFNYGNMPIKDLCVLPSNALKGEDENLYYTGVAKIKELLLSNWKQVKPYSTKNNKDFYKIFYKNKQEYLSNINDFEWREKIRQDNKEFFFTLKSLNINGIITMDIDAWSSAGGHTTFWESKEGFLDGTNYLNDKDEDIFVRELCFWKI